MTNHTPIPKEIYKEILNTMPICTVDVMFFNSDKTKILLLKRTNEPLHGVYFPIGGRVLKNELLEECAVRQAHREAGIQIDATRLVFGGVHDEINQNSAFEGVSYHAVALFYTYVLSDKEITELKINLDSQSDDYKWFSVFDEAFNHFLKKRIDVILKKS